MTTIDISPSYLLTTTRGLAGWMIDILADDYASTIRGSHGFGVRHPRAPWLTLVVSDNIECGTQGCDELARWEEDYDHPFCPRCAEAEVALAAARALRWPARRAPAGDLTRTVRVPAITMHAMVYGARALAVLALAFGLGVAGCATAPRPVEVESVGQLAASSSHVYSAAVHSTTDLTPAVGAVATDDDEPVTSASESLAILHREAAASGDVAVEAKADGVTTGGVR